MSAGHYTARGGNGFAYYYGKLRSFWVKHPQWWIYLLCLSAWVILFCNVYTGPGFHSPTGPIIYCMTSGSMQAEALPAEAIQTPLAAKGILAYIAQAITNGIVPWLLMVMAMMFPMLNGPVRHVFFAVRRRDRHAGILTFLLGYALAWTTAGLLFLITPLILDSITGPRGAYLNGLIKASGFLVAALLVWLPSRPTQLTKCSQTMPIRIGRPQLYTDCFRYGLKMGMVCLAMCWATMAALMLSHHSLLLMYIATVVLFYERYLLPHTSKLPAYAWMATALVLFGIEIWS